MTPRLVVLGASMGGMKALDVLLARLRIGFPAALVMVLHRSSHESGILLPLLQNICVLPVSFPLDKELILAGRVYIAPPDYHLLVEADHFAYSLDSPEDFARPSINALFESAAEAYAADVTGIILTGMRQDGARGLAEIYRCGGQAMVQSDAAAPQMPLAALAAVPNATQLSLKEIAAWLEKL